MSRESVNQPNQRLVRTPLAQTTGSSAAQPSTLGRKGSYEFMRQITLVFLLFCFDCTCVHAEPQLLGEKGQILFLVSSTHDALPNKKTRKIYPIAFLRNERFADPTNEFWREEEFQLVIKQSKNKKFTIEPQHVRCSDIPVIVETTSDYKTSPQEDPLVSEAPELSFMLVPDLRPKDYVSEYIANNEKRRSDYNVGSYDYDKDGNRDYIREFSGVNQLVVSNDDGRNTLYRRKMSADESVLVVKDLDGDQSPEIIIIKRISINNDFGIEVLKYQFGAFEAVFMKESYGCR